ncbi:MAG: class I SAM-dependent methyltransferase [Gammaproteobacteria bacterium]|nr:class I SAM-dependent methyltransferase [Gammaproteobacteria bacterium]
MPLDITVLNLANVIDFDEVSQHTFRYIEGDACELADLSGKDFDIVYSNSVIEHVGDVTRQKAFAAAVLSLNTDYWIQTPSKWFPVEAHCGMPFWWFYPDRFRQHFLSRWKEKLPAWTEMVEGTRVIEKQFFQELFPDGEVYVERLAGLPKSYIAWRSQGTHQDPRSTLPLRRT